MTDDLTKNVAVFSMGSHHSRWAPTSLKLDGVSINLATDSK